MELGSPFDALHTSLASACAVDLPDIVYQDRDWSAYRQLQSKNAAAIDLRNLPTIEKIRRPYWSEVEVIMFPQTWSSTALGYGGIGGSAMTPAYSVVVTHNRHRAIYFGSQGRLAYLLDYHSMSDAGRLNFNEDLARQCLASVRDHAERYGIKENPK